MEQQQTAEDLMERYANMTEPERLEFRAMLTGYDMHANPEAKKRTPRKAKEKGAVEANA